MVRPGFLPWILVVAMAVAVVRRSRRQPVAGTWRRVNPALPTNDFTAYPLLPTTERAPDSSFALTSDRKHVVIPTDGWYEVSAYGQVNTPAAGGMAFVGIGTITPSLLMLTQAGGTHPASSVVRETPTIIRWLTAGMTIGVYGYCQSAGAGFVYAVLSIARVGGPKGDKGDTGAITTVAANAYNGTVTSVPGSASAFVILPTGTLTTSTGTTNEFVRHAEGSVLVKQAGWYTITCSASCPVFAADQGQQYRLCIGANDTTPTTANTLSLADGSAPVPSQVITFTGYIAANSRIALLAANRDPTARSTGLLLFGIAQVNGAKGDKGDTGDGLDIYAQLAQATAKPTTTVPSQSWTWIPVPPTLTITSGSGGPDFTRNADGTLTINVAGNYHFAVNVLANASMADNTNWNMILCRKAGSLPALGDQIAQFNVTSGAQANNYPSASVAADQVCAVGDRIGMYMWQSAASTTVNVHAFSVHKTGTGPKGDKGDTGGNATVPIDPWHQVGDGGRACVLEFMGRVRLWCLHFRKDPLGRVYLRGSVNGGANGTVAFTLPVGYRPALAGSSRTRNIVIGNQTAVGQWELKSMLIRAVMSFIYFTGSAATSYISLDQIDFDSGTVTEMPTGPQGPKGDAGGTMGAAAARSTAAGASASYGPGWFAVPLPTALTVEPSDAFTFAGNNVTVKDAGWYDVSASVWVTTGTSATVFASLSTFATSGDGDIANSSGDTGFSRTTASGTVKLAAGAKVYLYGYTPSTALSVACANFSIARVGGPQGPPGGNAAVPIESVHFVGGLGEPAFQNAWINYDNNAAVPGTGSQRSLTFRKDPFGKVFLSGTVKSGASGTAIFTLPVGYRPRATVYVSGFSGGNVFAYIWIDIGGSVYAANSGGGNVNLFVMLDEVEFDTEAVMQMPTGPQGPPGPGVRGLVTALPSLPADGDECYFLAADSMGIVWHLRYRTSSGAAYKWDVIGALPLYAGVDTAEARNNGVYGNLTTAGPYLTAPLAGTYLVEHGCEMDGGVAQTFAAQSYSIGATAAVDADFVEIQTGTGGARFPVMRRQRRDLGKNIQLACQYRTSGTVTFSRRWISITPVAVG